ncbi:thioredoxin-like protein [Haematococcus lacustris]
MQHSLSARLPSSRVACVPRAPRVVQTRALPPQGLGLDPELRKTIDEVVAKNKVVAFIKGTRQFPQCGFSNTVCQILTSMKVPYETVNILENERLRSGMKEYSQWPTFPQVYVGGEFVGGCDIMIQMFQSGELTELLEKEMLS